MIRVCLRIKLRLGHLGARVMDKLQTSLMLTSAAKSAKNHCPTISKMSEVRSSTEGSSLPRVVLTIVMFGFGKPVDSSIKLLSFATFLQIVVDHHEL